MPDLSHIDTSSTAKPLEACRRSSRRSSRARPRSSRGDHRLSHPASQRARRGMAIPRPRRRRHRPSRTAPQRRAYSPHRQRSRCCGRAARRPHPTLEPVAATQDPWWRCCSVSHPGRPLTRTYKPSGLADAPSLHSGSGPPRPAKARPTNNTRSTSNTSSHESNSGTTDIRTSPASARRGDPAPQRSAPAPRRAEGEPLELGRYETSAGESERSTASASKASRGSSTRRPRDGGASTQSRRTCAKRAAPAKSMGSSLTTSRRLSGSDASRWQRPLATSVSGSPRMPSASEALAVPPRMPRSAGPSPSASWHASRRAGDRAPRPRTGRPVTDSWQVPHGDRRVEHAYSTRAEQ
jgi:hypothetical protein